MAMAIKMSQEEQSQLQSRMYDLMNYDPETGLFTWLVSRGAVRAGDVAGCIHIQSGYIYITIDGKQHLAARLAYLFMTGRFPQPTVDHKNQNRADNRWVNLREADFQQQRINQGDRAKNASRAAIEKVDGKANHLDQFDEFEDACLANIYAELAMDCQSGTYNGGGVA
jgi:hypothetical protein